MSTRARQVMFILYVQDQEAARVFYERLFRTAPALHVPGMTEFLLADGSRIGLMPNAGIARILAHSTPHPADGNGIPRCELYLHVDDVQAACTHATECGATPVSPVAARDWGDRACYFADPDGHIIAFAQPR